MTVRYRAILRYRRERPASIIDERARLFSLEFLISNVCDEYEYRIHHIRLNMAGMAKCDLVIWQTVLVARLKFLSLLKRIV